MDRRTDKTKITVVFCNFTNAPEKKKPFRKTVTRCGLNSLLTAWQSVRLLRKHCFALYIQRFTQSSLHLFTYGLLHGAAENSGFIDLVS